MTTMSTESKRKLTKHEIKGILSFIVPNSNIPKDVAFAKTKNIVKQLKTQLKAIEIYPSLIPKLKKEIERQFYISQIQPGESVGITCAQANGEKQTQANLNTFHKAGSSEKQPVTSMFSELLNATKKPKVPTCMVYFERGNETVGNLRDTLGSSLVQLTFRKLTTDYEVYVEKEEEPWYAAYKLIEGDDFEDYTDCLSLQINMDLLYTYKLTLKEIADFISLEYSDMVCVYSPDCFGRVDIFVDTREIDLPEEQMAHITEENAREIYLDDVVQPILMDIVVCGIPGVDNMYFLREEDTKTDAWMVELENTQVKLPVSIFRFKQILAHPAVDMTRTISNNIWDIYHTLGVEAVREYMIEKFIQIMDGINPCHVMILVDKMTHAGSISSISRYTMRQEESGPFGKASFEETLDNFLKAGVFGQEEPTRGVSASIICGKQASIGTGLCELRMDMNMLLGTVKEDSNDEEM